MGDYFQERFRSLVTELRTGGQRAVDVLHNELDNIRRQEVDRPTFMKQLESEAIDRYHVGAEARKAKLRAACREQLDGVPAERAKLRRLHLERVAKALQNVGALEWYRADLARLAAVKDWAEIQRRYEDPANDLELFAIEAFAPPLMGDQGNIIRPVQPEGMGAVDDWEAEIRAAESRITEVCNPVEYQHALRERYGLQNDEGDAAIGFPTKAAAPSPVGVKV